jgi:Asp-tRNA(Asn)/Glu-tRNA(Gln) amidotransferase A subunit family amidase
LNENAADGAVAPSAGLKDKIMTDDRQTLLQSIWKLQSGATPRNARLAAAQTRTAALEPWLKAFSHLPETHAVDDAASGPLAGIPVGVKDIIATSDMPTTNGSPIYAGHIPDADAWIVAKIKAYGGIVFGKTVSTEFAWRHPGATVNPWNRDHTPGGSSSGSAASVAAGIVPLALGSQTLGSIVRPAAFNGVVGYKPSYGAIPRDGVHPLAGSLDHVGFFTRSVADAAAAYALFIAQNPDAVTSEAAWQTYFPRIAPPKFAVIRTGVWDRADAEQKQNFEAQLAAFQNAGAELIEFDMPGDTEVILAAISGMVRYEGARIYRDLVAAHPDKTSKWIKQLVVDGYNVSDERYHEIQALQTKWRAALADWIAPCDAILTLSATGEAPLGLDNTGDAAFCSPWTFFGVPAINLPSGWSAKGLPLGLQVAGIFGEDKKLLQAAAWAENIINFPARTVA